MLEADLRRIRRARRGLARGPLRVLLEYACARAILPLAGELIEDERVIRRALDLTEAAIWRLADARAFLYFGIRCAAELGPMLVHLQQLDEVGTVRVVVGDAVEAILMGGARRSGWTSPRDLTVEDLEL